MPASYRNCNARLCKREYGGIDNYAYTRGGESMYRWGFAKCLTCNCYYHIQKTLMGRRLCECCKCFLRFGPRKYNKITVSN